MFTKQGNIKCAVTIGDKGHTCYFYKGTKLILTDKTITKETITYLKHFNRF